MKSPIKAKAAKTVKATTESTVIKKKLAFAKPLALKPRVSEKGYALSESVNVYTFDVPSEVNKFEVAAAVKLQYEVSVLRVRLASVPGKAVRAYRNGGRKSINAKRSDVRKAYVTLKAGDKLPIFAAVEPTEAPKETK